MWKVVGYVFLFLTIAVGGGIVGCVFGFLNGATRIGEPSAEAMANSLYRAAQQGRYEDIVTDKLATSEVAESVRKSQYEKGAIRSWAVVRLRVNMLGLPVLVEVEVQRNKKELEVLIIHAPFRFHSHSLAAKSIIND